MWGTIEAEAWSRNLEYEDYVSLHRQSGHVCNALCKEAYELVCKALEVQLEYDHGDEK